MTTPVNFRVKNGLTVANGVAVTQGNVTISNGSLVIGSTVVNSSFINTAAENAYANSLIYADGRAADAYSNGVLYTDNKAGNAYSNAVAFAANASNISSGTLSNNRLPQTVNVAVALNVTDKISIVQDGITVRNANDTGTLTASRLSFLDSNTEVGNTFYVSTTHDELITSKTYDVANVTYADYGRVSRNGFFAVVGLNTTNNSIYVRGVTVNTSVISIGNSSVFSSINSTAFSGNGASLTSVNAATVGGNSASDLRTYTENLASNATYLTSGTVNSARLPSGNSTAAGAVVLVDSVSNTSTTAAASAAAVKTAYDAAIAANTAAGTLAGTAYSNAVSFANTKANDAYSNAVAYSSNASNLSSGTVAIARIPTVDAVDNTSISYVATANSVKTAYDAAISANTRAASAQTAASDAYTNATAFAANASNLSSGTVNIARIPVVDAVNNTSISHVAAANSVKTAYDVAITANTNAQTALTAAGAAYTNATAFSSNATNLTSGTVNSARLPSGNSTSAGAVVLVDSVSNTSTTAAASAASVKTAYDAAITANTNAQTALTAAESAYTNAVSYTDTKIGTANTAMVANAAAAYTNAVSYTDTKIGTANSAITGNAATAYTNATTFAANATNISSGTVNIARLPVLDAVNNTSVSYVATANSVKTAYDAAITANTNAQTALTAAGSAYTNAVSYTDSKIATANSAITGNAATAYTNAVSYTDTKIGTANTAMTANAATAYTNAVSYTDTKIGTANSAITGNAATAYTNAVSYVDTKIGTANTAMVANAAAAYTNATVFAANASNANNGTLAEARLPYRMNQDVRTTDTVTFGNITVTGNITVQGTTTTVNTVTLSVQDNLIYLNANNTTDNPDLGFAGNYNDGTYHHAGFFRDATDGVWKVFDNYAPEPDANAYIDTSNNTFRIAAFQANTVYLGNTSVYGTINGTAFSGTANNSSYLGGSSLATIQGQITGNADAAYTNATTFAANATNLTNGTIPYARIPANVVNTSAAFTLSGIITHAANVVLGSVGLSANGGFGTAGHVLHSNGTATYWAADDQGVTSVDTGNGLTGGTITSTGTVSILANTGIVANSTGAFVNSAYIATISSNNTTYVNGKTEGNLNVNAAAQLTTARTIGDVSFNGTANIVPERITYKDTRASNYNPFTHIGATLHLKTNTTDSLSDGGTYHGVLDLAHWSDSSGGVNHQLGLTDNNNLYIRASSNSTAWTAWSRLYKEGSVLTPSANVVMANNNITNPVLTGYTEAEVANTSTTGTWTMDCTAANFFDLTLTGNITISPTNVPPSTRMWAGTIVAKQDATGGRTITWPTGTKWPGGVVPPATTTANAIDIWSLMTYDGGSTWIGSLTVKGAA